MNICLHEHNRLTVLLWKYFFKGKYKSSLFHTFIQWFTVKSMTIIFPFLFSLTIV